MFLVVFTFFFCDFVNASCMKEISITGYELVPKFNTNTYKYNVFINGNSILIKGKSKNENSNITGLGNYDVLSDKSEFVIECDDEKYIIKTFKDNLVEDSKDAYLSFLEVSGAYIEFDRNTFVYEIERQENIDIKYSLSDDRASAVVIENDKNEIVITVTSYDKTNVKEYIIKMNELKKVNLSNNDSKKVREMNNYEKSGVILLLSCSVLFIINFIRKKIF